jgi:hypothetical protein
VRWKKEEEERSNGFEMKVFTIVCTHSPTCCWSLVAPTEAEAVAAWNGLPRD